MPPTLRLRLRALLRAAIYRVQAWLDDLDARLSNRQIITEDTNLDSVTNGELSYEIDMAFVEGQTCQDVLAAACASTAIYAVRGRNVGPLADATVKHGTYWVSTRVVVEFNEVPDDGHYVPVFNGAELTRLLSRGQR